MFIGLDKIIEELEKNASSGITYPHVLLEGPRGSGKTTLSNYIGKITKRKMITLNAPAVNFQKLQSVILSLGKNSILFIDEIHRLHPKVEEMLYHPMENGEFYLNGFKMKIPPFTLIGATTRPDLITKPLQSRFQLRIAVPKYSIRELTRIVKQGYPELSRKDSILIARCASVPREVLNLGYRLRQLKKSIPEGLLFLNYIDGLSKQERDYLKYLQMESKSVSSLSAYLMIPEQSVGEIEQRLIQLGLISITSKGRILSPRGLMKVSNLS